MMSYLKIQVSDTLKLTWLRASMHARGVLVTLLMYCCAQENDGVIENCEAWTDDEWRDLLRMTRADVEAVLATDLAWWNEHGDLVLGMYDSDGQRALETKRAQGDHGIKGGRPKKKTHMGNPYGFSKEKPIRGNPCHNPHTTPHQCGEDSPKGSTSPGTLGFVAPVPDTGQKSQMDLRALMIRKDRA